MNIRQLFLVVLYIALVVVFLWTIPLAVYDHFPIGLREYLGSGGATLNLLILFLGVPIAGSLLFVGAGICWLLLSRLFARRQDVEELLSTSLLGGRIGQWTTRMLSAIYSDRQEK